MKNLSILLILLSFNSFATGGFECRGIDSNVAISGMTSRIAGSPIVGDLQLTLTDNSTVTIAKEQIVGYWNEFDKIKLKAITNDASDVLAELNVAKFFYRTTGYLILGKRHYKVRCDVE